MAEPELSREGSGPAGPACLRCGRSLPPDNSLAGYCSTRHRAEARQQLQAFRKAGPGCGICYRGGVFFRWRPEGGRIRVPGLNLEQQHVAPCSCPAGQKLVLESGYKTWGYMRDFAPDGNPERVEVPPVKRREAGA